MKAMKLLRSICAMMLIFGILCGFAVCSPAKAASATCGETHLDLESWHEEDGTHYAFCYACKTEIIGQQCIIEEINRTDPGCTAGGQTTEICVGGINPISGKIDRNAHTLTGGCDYSLTTELPPSHDFYTNNGDGTHTISCTCSEAVNNSVEAHSFVNGKCVFCGAPNPGKLLDFRPGSPEVDYRWLSSVGSLSIDTNGNGFLNGTVNGQDPYIDMDHNNIVKRLAYTIGKNDVVQLRVKLDLDGVDASSARYAVYLGFASGAEYWKEGGFYSISTNETKVDDDGFVIVTMPLKDHAQKTLQYVRVDFMEWQESKSFTGNFSVDYIYFGPLSNSPAPMSSSHNTLLDFKEGSREVTRFRWTDTHSASVSFSGKGSGYMNGEITDLDPYVGMSSLDTANTLDHIVQPGQIIKIRSKVNLNEINALGLRYGFYLGFASGEAYWTGGLSFVTTTEYTDDGDGYVIVSTALPADRVGQSLKYVRIDFAEWHSNLYTGTYSIDYIYLGDPCSAPNASHTWDNGSITTAPTCGTDGVKTYTCTTCSATRTEAVAGTEHVPVTDKAVAPTCDKTGLTEGSHCSVCQEVLVPQNTVPALGHKYTDSVTAPTCQTEGYTTHTCTVCGYSFKDSYVSGGGHSYIYIPEDEELHIEACENCFYSIGAPHTFVNGVCVCGETESKTPVLDPNLKLNHSLNLASDISVNLIVPRSLLAGFDMNTVYVESTMEVYDSLIYMGTETVRIDPVKVGDYYYFTLTGITAVQLNDTISSVLYGTKNGQPYYSNVDSYSVATYAYAQLNKSTSSASLKALCANLLRYGAKAQIFKDYRTNALADEKLTAAQRAYLTDLDSVTFGNTNTVLNDMPNASITWSGKALSLDSKVCLKFIFSLNGYKGNPEDLILRVSYKDVYGEAMYVAVTGAELYNPDKGMYSFTLDSLLASELREVVSVRVYDGTTAVSPTLQYSADTYGNNKTGNLLELCKALFAYSDSAKAFFAN